MYEATGSYHTSTTNRVQNGRTTQMWKCGEITFFTTGKNEPTLFPSSLSP